MDLLSAAYSVTSDDDADGTEATPAASCAAMDFPSATPPPPKRPRWEPSPYLPPPDTIPQPAASHATPLLAAPTGGRYVSKRERALLAVSQAPVGSVSPLPSPVASEFNSPVVGSITDSNLRADILHSLRCQPKPGSTRSSPLKLSVSLTTHTNAVNCLDWSPSHGHLLASAGMDHTVHVWNVWNKGSTAARVFKYHNAAVKNVRWSLHGPSLLSGGFDCSLRLVDVEEGKEIRVFKEDQAVEVIKFNPSNSNLFLSGGSKGSLRIWQLPTVIPTATSCSISGLPPFRLAAGASASRLRYRFGTRRMLPHATSRNPSTFRFKPLLPTKPLLAPASSRGSLFAASASRRDFLLLVPSLVAASTALQYLPLMASAADDEKLAPPPPAAPAPAPAPPPAGEPDAAALSRVYDATVIGEPQAVGKDARGRVWEKLMAARVVYLGEAELVPDRDDRVLELEIVRKLAARCAEAGRSVSLALEAFPHDLQEQLNRFMDGRIDGNNLRLYTSHWAPERWQEYEPLLNYCRDNGIKLVACGTPLEVVRTVQAEGIRGLSKAQRKLYAPPAGSGFISGFTSISGQSLIDKIASTLGSPFGPSSYLSAQARVVDDYTMSQTIMKEITNGDPSGMLVVVTGASHVIYGSRGIGVPARISKKMQKKKQVVILLDPERQGIRREGEIPVADFLWYSAAKPCSRNCFDRAEIARVMNAAGRRREALPQDLQKGIDLGVVSPEILQNFFDLEKYPVMAELIHRFQGFRERLLADPKFLHRLAIEEAISITTTLVAQYEKRKGRFFEEIDYVLTDTIRGSVVDFFTVWLPAPTISLLSIADDGSGESLELVKGLLGALPDNAFQKGIMGQNWNINQRFASVLMGGIKLAGVGYVSSIGAGVASDVLYAARQVFRPSASMEAGRKRSPIWKSAAVYSFFLGTSANLRYQVIAGLVEHRLGEDLMAYYNQPLLASLLSFATRTVNSYWGTQQWIDLARHTGVQTSKKELPSPEISESPEMPLLECGTTEVQNVDDINNQSSDRT